MPRYLKTIIIVIAILLVVWLGVSTINYYTQGSLTIDQLFKGRPTAAPESSATEPPPTGTPYSPSATPLPTRVVVELPPVAIGIPLDHDGLSITVFGATLLETLGEFTPMPGMIYMVADIEFRNISLDQFEYLFFFMGFEDENGISYYPPHPSPDVAPQPTISSGVLMKGESIRGNILFEIPSSTTAGIFKYNFETDLDQTWYRTSWEK